MRDYSHQCVDLDREIFTSLYYDLRLTLPEVATQLGIGLTTIQRYKTLWQLGHRRVKRIDAEPIATDADYWRAKVHMWQVYREANNE